MRNEYNRLFDKITSGLSDEELLNGALRKAENMKARTGKKLKRPLIVAAAVITVLAVGVTGAAATGLIRFDEIFGRTITAETEQLGNDLIGDAKDAVISCSDDDYIVTLKGVTGTANSILASLNVSRKDGTPLFDAESEEEEVQYSLGEAKWQLGNDKKFYGSGYYIEGCENGSIDIYAEYKMMFEEFYSDDGISGEYMQLLLNELTLTDDKLDIAVEFTYVPSDTSLRSLTCKEFPEGCVILFNVSGETDGLPSGRNISFDTQLTALDIRAESGMLSGRLALGDYDWNKIVLNSFRCDNDIELIRKDGSSIPVSLEAYHLMRAVEGYLDFTMELEYRQLDEMIGKAIDLTEVAAISINGTIYTLE